ncbi:MAG TPA: NrtA/SsuA/CpmA family ABC transporter substrate-binding protein [Pelolinea sp.]|nr:NrtA/SsuA/CpmA family ABC transporter substrate-binding protein [Pelolinea sp.]
MSIRRNKFLFFMLALMLISALTLTACGGNAAEPDVALSTVRYGGQLYPEEFLLKGQDFFSKYELTVEHTLFSSGGENNQALISGAIDANIGSDSKSVGLFGAMGDKVVIIAASQRGDRYSTMIQKDSGITSWYDMKGEKVGIRLGTGAEQVVRRYFEQVGDLKWEDFEWVDLKVEDMAAALADGVISSFTAWEPTPAIAEATTDAVVMMSYGDIALTPVLIHTTKEFAESHKEELVAFLRGHLDKVAMIQNEVDEAARVAAEAASAQGTEVSAEVFKAIFQRVNFSLDVDDEVMAALKDTAKFLMDIGEIDTIPEFYVDTSFLEQAKKLNK